jgi:hypothetical protein
MIRAILLFVSILYSGVCFAADYHIGPGQTYTSIAGFTGWTSLLPGDHVYIHYATYKEHILLCQSGTEANPIIIEGVPDGSGNLPIIDGADAVIPTQFNGHLPSTIYQGQGIIYVNRSVQDDAFGVSPEWITIKNLEIKSATPELYTFTNTLGGVQAYLNGSSGIYIKVGNHILIENCIIHDCGNGFDVQGVDAMVHDVTVRSCYIYGNGRTDARFDREHNIYTEASGITFEYNLIGPMRNGTGGSALKDRSANTVIRYNTIYSGARTLDLVEPENQATLNCDGTGSSGGMHEEPGFADTWVYGNVFINVADEVGPYAGMPFHYGADNCPAISRKGTLHFYNNTVYVDIDSGQTFNTRLFDITSNLETLDLYNNVIVSVGTTTLYLAYLHGEINLLGGNWIQSGFNQTYGGFDGTYNNTVAPLTGASAGFTNQAAYDFSIAVGSPLIGAGVALPAGITVAHNVTRQYLSPRSYSLRSSVSDIGAYAYGASQGETCSDGIQNQNETGIDCGGVCDPCSSPAPGSRSSIVITPNGMGMIRAAGGMGMQ